MINIRTDDFDLRARVEDIKPIHELFLEKNFPFTIGVNNSVGEQVGMDEDLVNYVNSTDGWDIQLHGFNHDHFWMMRYPDIYKNLASNLAETKKLFPKANPTIFYPPWNETGQNLESVCEALGLKMVIGVHIRFWLNWKRRDNNNIFFHWWDKQDLDMLPVLFNEVT